ncbi:uncharacterized protein LOC124170618 [Ischnura elegans]|uniref:uncharacterized protein LOC124170618 n=1 Tax=Ischnura elegans TaxID=197161 RepID=UPI001ED8B6D7|nr:uncharacterized protein LOC124170618 [Ischnura elegans]XP_046405405.1 uncharacterized protein LOC124170618 [Ischnura elegans]XP_046405406.1 uncharacterized protein LOC124170618 [Ischnura elegans]XP_046405407.1 uncharacterized protein LOC124170618 [Ischnura elegans]XP_046405408.1 uncharacterized protein LOC124170618 [Ischnura elegans]XP_046405409.1 uncharacterized protein LOC124170618 [Ischnura elegans]XP_046405411.1 uncharacterized protein LOC124170618 [Ischnura elegans]XP_046405412.1 unc
MRLSSSGRLGQYLLCLALCHSALPGAGYFLKRSKEAKEQRKQGNEYVPAGGGKSSQREPSCEELRAMWRFSKRQSRAAEITNEIPSYADPFAYSVWEPYPRSAAIGSSVRSGNTDKLRGGGGEGHQIIPASGAAIARAKSRARQRRPVYGRIVHTPPASTRLRENLSPERIRAFEEVTRMFETGRHLSPQIPKSTARKTFRFSGPVNSQMTGSFQQIKDIIREERARELKQRMLEEREASNMGGMVDESSLQGPTYRSHGPTPHSPFDSIRFSGGRFGAIAEPQEPKPRGVLAFPDILAPSAKQQDDLVLMNPLPPSLSFPKTVTAPTMPTVEERDFGDSVRYVERGGRSYKHHRMTTGHKGHPQGHIRDDLHMSRLNVSAQSSFTSEPCLRLLPLRSSF